MLRFIGLTFAFVGWSPPHPVYCGAAAVADGGGDGVDVVAGDGVSDGRDCCY